MEWEFSSLEKLFGAVEGNRDLQRYAAEADLFRNTYYLACATYASMYPRLATGLWKLLAQLEAAGEYAEMSRRQLKKPWVEPYLIPLKKAAGKP